MDPLLQIRSLVEQVVGAQVLGVYLHGSAVDGGLKPASDIDVLVVTRRSLDQGERRALVAGLLPISGAAAGARSMELTVVVEADVRPWRYPPRADFLYGDWLRDEIADSGPPQPARMPGLAVEIRQVLATGRTLAGPGPDQLLDPVPAADVVRAGLDGIPALLADLSGDSRNVVLTLARIWVTVATGQIVPKDAAADWALTHLPPEHRPVLDHAKMLYLTSTYAEEQPWTPVLQEELRPYVDAVLHRISELGARRHPGRGDRSARSDR